MPCPNPAKERDKLDAPYYIPSHPQMRTPAKRDGLNAGCRPTRCRGLEMNETAMGLGKDRSTSRDKIGALGHSRCHV